MDKVLFNTVFNRKSSLLPNGTALIQIEAYLKGKKKYFTTKLYITPDQWDSKHRTIKAHPNQIKLNKQIKDFINSLEDAEMTRRQSGKPFSLDYLSEFVKGSITSSFIEFCDRELKKENLSNATEKNHRSTINYMTDFNKDAQFEDITFEYLNDFEQYLTKQTYKKSEKSETAEKPLHTNTIAKHLTVVRRYVNLAINKELIDLNKYPFRKFKIQRLKTYRDYLTPEELERIENLRLPAEMAEYQTALDKYLFSCYTGLRYSDVSALSPKNLILEDGKEWIILTMQKTGEEIRLPIYLPVFGKALDILYNYISGKPTVFPYQQNETINQHLRAIATKAEIKKNITFHTARHTQATYLLYKGVSITTVQKLLGHKKLETTQIYSKVMDMTVINELQNISFNR
jgi:integrase